MPAAEKKEVVVAAPAVPGKKAEEEKNELVNIILILNCVLEALN
jgi:hypothetical protein